MTEEEKKAAQEAKESEEKSKEIEDKSTKDESEEEDDDQHNDIEIDHKATIERERKAREKAERALAKKRWDSSQEKKKKQPEDIEEEEEEDEDDDDDNKPLTRAEARKLFQANAKASEKKILAETISTIAKEIADSPDEAEAIVAIHSNREFPSDLSLRDQLLEAQAIAFAPILRAKNKELARALKNKGNVSRDIASDHKDGQRATPPKISNVLEASLVKSGFTYNSNKKLWLKKLPNGKYLAKDPKTGRTKVI